MFTINSTRIDGETLTANVTFTMKDGTKIDTDVPYFMPQSSDDVINALSNREESEKVKYEVVPILEQIKQEIDGMDQKAISDKVASLKVI